MGLSRNKVAVSEGAAGSPPFYGEPRSDELRRNGSAEAQTVIRVPDIEEPKGTGTEFRDERRESSK